MATDLALTGAALFALVFLSTTESAYESLSEITLRVMLAEREQTSRHKFFRELLDHRLRFELMLILGTQLSTVLIALLLFDISLRLEIPVPLVVTFVAAFVVVIVFRQLIPRMLAQNNPE